MLALDVSDSMQFSRCVGASAVGSHMASAAMAMMTARTERHCKFVAFSHEIVLLGISSRMKLNEILNIINEVSFSKFKTLQFFKFYLCVGTPPLLLLALWDLFLVLKLFWRSILKCNVFVRSA